MTLPLMSAVFTAPLNEAEEAELPVPDDEDDALPQPLADNFFRASAMRFR
jgi:hypothetical protein